MGNKIIVVEPNKRAANVTFVTTKTEGILVNIHSLYWP
jgi:hypothetical protein